MLINAGVKEIIYVNDYPDDLALQLLEEAKLPIRKWAPESFLDSPVNEG
jgi:deoxycytidylate deaminase